jgi:hypothetical protein
MPGREDRPVARAWEGVPEIGAVEAREALLDAAAEGVELAVIADVHDGGR